MLHNFAEASDRGSALEMPEAFKGTIEAYVKMHAFFQPEDARYLQNHTGHLMFIRDGDRSFLTGKMIKALTFTGTREALLERGRRLEKAGYDQLAIQLVPGAEVEIGN